MLKLDLILKDGTEIGATMADKVNIAFAEIENLANNTSGGNLKSDGTVPMDQGYSPVVDQDLVTKKYISDLPPSGELRAITQGNGKGYGLEYRTQNLINYASIGLQAVDFSNSTSTDLTGAEGSYSFCTGSDTHARGQDSTAQGTGTKTINQAQTAQGKFNTGTSTDTIQEIGIGLDDTHRANALEVYTDGTLTIPESDPSKIDQRGLKALVSKEYVESLDVNGGNF